MENMKSRVNGAKEMQFHEISRASIIFCTGSAELSYLPLLLAPVSVTRSIMVKRKSLIFILDIQPPTLGTRPYRLPLDAGIEMQTICGAAMCLYAETVAPLPKEIPTHVSN